MKPKRVDCCDCENFYLSRKNKKVKLKYSCKIGKKVMFRLPTNILMDNGGFWRYCEDYKENEF